jgi:cyclic beta-1,2-glucan synthetase
MYRAVLESILGLRLRGDVLRVDPCIPRGWRGFELVLRHRSARYEISVRNPNGVSRGVVRVQLAGENRPLEDGIALLDDSATHRVVVTLG